MNDPAKQWQKLVEAARHAAPSRDGAERPPPGFASRIVALRTTVAAVAQVLFWRRWSVTTAVFCAIAFVAILIVHQCTDTPAPLIETPDLQQPSL